MKTYANLFATTAMLIGSIAAAPVAIAAPPAEHRAQVRRDVRFRMATSSMRAKPKAIAW